MEYIKAVIKCEIKVMDPPLKSVRGREEQSGLRSSFASEGEEFERRTKKNLRLDKKVQALDVEAPPWERWTQPCLLTDLTC